MRDHLEFVHGFNDTPAPQEVTEAAYLLHRMRGANPSAAIYVEGGKWAPHRGPRDFSNQHRQASKRVARNRARTKAAHRARMAQKGRK